MSKKALITGGSRGIGAECAKALALDGWDVYINYYRSEDKAIALAKELGATALKADVSDFISVASMFEKVGGVDLLVCNAGVSDGQRLFTDTAPSDWKSTFSVNVNGVFNACRCAIPHMVHNKSGCIITVSSIWGQTGASCEAVYSASKAAVIGFSKALAKELGPSGIRVNCICPGVIDTEMNSHLSAEDIEALKDETPLCSIGTPRDIANTVSFLASDKASFITGQVLGVNGGMLI